MKNKLLVLPLALGALILTGCRRPAASSSAPTSNFVLDPDTIEFASTYGYSQNVGPDGVSANLNAADMGSSDDTLIISSIIDTSRTEYVIPSEVRGLKVTEISARAFRQVASTVEKIVIPATVQTIGEDAFANCAKLRTIEIAAGSELQMIGSGALTGTPFLTSAREGGAAYRLGDVLIAAPAVSGTYQIPAGVRGIYDDTFADFKSLQQVSLPADLIQIGQRAFAGSGLTRVELPDSVIAVGREAFKDCADLVYAALPANSAFVYPSSANYFSGAGRLAEISYDGGAELRYLLPSDDPSALALKKVTLRDNGSHKVVKNALQNYASIEEVVIGSGIEETGAGALSGLSLKQLTVSDDFAFMASLDLEGTAYYDSLPNNEPIYIGSCFYGFKGAIPSGFALKSGLKGLAPNSLKDLVAVAALPASISYVGEQALNGSKSLTSIELPHARYLGSQAFKDCVALRSVSIASEAEIGKELFLNCLAIESIDMNFSLSMTDLFGEQMPKIHHLDIAEGLTSIKASTFKDLTSLESVSFPSTLTTIGNYAFMGCTSLKEVTIPETVSSIGAWAFARCTSLERVTFEDTTLLREENGRFYPQVTLAINTWAFAFNTKMADEFTIKNRTMKVNGNILFGSSVKKVIIEIDDYYLNGSIDKFDPLNALNAMKYTDGWNETDTKDSYGNQQRIPYVAVIKNFPRG